MLSDDELLDLAGRQAFARGRAYHVEGRIALARHDADGLEGEAEGSERYSLRLARNDGGWRWSCSCPAADDGAFCKHLVAAVLTAREDSAVDEPPATSGKSNRSADLAAFLRAQPAERLAEWLLTLAREDSTIEKRLHLYRAADDPAALKTALSGLLATGGLLDYHRSKAYARRLDDVIAQLQGSIARDPVAARTLCEYVLGRLLKVYARSDDSSGAIGDRLERIAELHVQACNAAPPGKALVKPLLALQLQDEWDTCTIDAYWHSLGADGQADYGARIVAEFEQLREKPGANDRWGKAFAVERRAEAYARISGDFALLQRVLRRHLDGPNDYMRVLESLRGAGRAREAQDWAEQAVKRFPQVDVLRNALADCLLDAGLDEDAIAQTWVAFRQDADPHNWEALKRISGAQWPTWRERALAEVASHEREDEATMRVILLEHDGDIDGAVEIASRHKVRCDLLQRLAKRVEGRAPQIAGEFHLRVANARLHHLDTPHYPELVSTLTRIARCLPPERWKPLLTKIRTEYRNRRKLMRLMDDAEL